MDNFPGEKWTIVSPGSASKPKNLRPNHTRGKCFIEASFMGSFQNYQISEVKSFRKATRRVILGHFCGDFVTNWRLIYFLNPRGLILRQWISIASHQIMPFHCPTCREPPRQNGSLCLVLMRVPMPVGMLN